MYSTIADITTTKLVHGPETLATLARTWWVRFTTPPAVQLPVRRTQLVRSPVPVCSRRTTPSLQEAAAKVSTRQVRRL